MQNIEVCCFHKYKALQKLNHTYRHQRVFLPTEFPSQSSRIQELLCPSLTHSLNSHNHIHTQPHKNTPSRTHKHTLSFKKNTRTEWLVGKSIPNQIMLRNFKSNPVKKQSKKLFRNSKNWNFTTLTNQPYNKNRIFISKTHQTYIFFLLFSNRHTSLYTLKREGGQRFYSEGDGNEVKKRWWGR